MFKNAQMGDEIFKPRKSYILNATVLLYQNMSMSVVLSMSALTRITE
jgi:hypothetical protein